MKFLKASVIRAPASVVFAFHERPDALALLTPPWQRTEIVQPPASLAVGTRVILRTRFALVWQTIVAEHVEYERGRMFADRMVEGPFARWLHRHIITPVDETSSTLTDDVDYDLPLGVLGRVFGAPIARGQLDRLFAYRHEVTRRACEQHEGQPPLSS
jgi:ligand-binding SRPBCC domain-containing protein